MYYKQNRNCTAIEKFDKNVTSFNGMTTVDLFLVFLLTIKRKTKRFRITSVKLTFPQFLMIVGPFPNDLILRPDHNTFCYRMCAIKWKIPEIFEKTLENYWRRCQWKNDISCFVLGPYSIYRRRMNCKHRKQQQQNVNKQTSFPCPVPDII